MSKHAVVTQSRLVERMAKEWPRITALLGGTSKMREAGVQFLPKWQRETDTKYSSRLNQSVLFPAFSRTAKILAAKPFMRPITFDGAVPEPLKERFANVDLNGTTLHAYCSNLALLAMQYGVCGVLVDAPRALNVRTLADAKRAGVRPYLATYPATSFLGWLSEDGVLRQIRLFETVEEATGRFANQVIEQVRVLEKVGGVVVWEIWRKAEKSDDWIVVDTGFLPTKTIPFTFFTARRSPEVAEMGYAESPLIDLAHLNILHWQSWSDQQNLENVARAPILFAKGFDDADAIVVGASGAVVGSGENSDLKFVEHSGAAIGAGRASLADLEGRMRQIGAELLVQRSMTVTARQVDSEDEAEKSEMQMIAEGFDASIDSMLKHFGEWLGVDYTANAATFKDFGGDDAVEEITAALALHSRGAISTQSLFDLAKATDMVPHDRTWEDESKRVAENPVTPAMEAVDERKKEKEKEKKKPGVRE